MKKFIKISIVATAAMILLAQVGFSTIANKSVTDDQFSKEIKQFNDGINNIMSSSSLTLSDYLWTAPSKWTTS